MRFTRAAKVAAFPLTALILVALVACQGPVGVKGDKGDKGDMGDMGTPGDTGDTGDTGMDGPVGPAALVAKSGDTPNILINDGKAADGADMLGGAETYDVFGLFSGGSGDITYTAAQADVMGDPPAADTAKRALYEASIEEGTSILTVKFKGTTTTVLHTVQFTIDVSATDEAGTTVTTQVMAQRNAAPVALTTDIPDFRIGTQDMDWPDSNNRWPTEPYTCEKLNACKLTFTDQHFTDQGDLTYSATSESANVQLSSVDGGIMIVGVTHTADDGANDVAEQITVTVTAEDMGGLTVERTFKVNVDGAPTDGDFSATDKTISMEELIPTSFFFSDPEMNDLTYSLEDFKENPYITAALDTSTGVLTLDVTGKTGGGPVAVTVRATEPNDGDAGVGQSHDITIMVTHGS